VSHPRIDQRTHRAIRVSGSDIDAVSPKEGVRAFICAWRCPITGLMQHVLFILVWGGIPIGCVVLGCLPLPWWTVAIGPVVEVGAFVTMRAMARPDDEFYGAYLTLGVVFAVASIVFWAGGRALLMWVRWVRNKDPLTGRDPHP
jgi:hypothetical protein